MIYRLLLTFFILITNSILYAQISNIVFVGTAMVKGGGNYTYKLLVNDSAGILSGHSITDVMGPNETRTAVTGRINASKKQLTFRETRIIQTKSTASAAEFCYIHANLKHTTLQGASSLRGTFKGYSADGKTECASGKMVLVCAQDVLDKLMEIAEKDPQLKEKVDSLKAAHPATIVYEKEIPEAEVKKLLPGTTGDVAIAATTATVELWDFRTIDGDRISLFRDGVAILENYTLTGTRKRITIDMAGSSATTLELKALNEGDEPLNTARIMVSSGGIEQYIDASTTVDKSVRIVLTKKAKGR